MDFPNRDECSVLSLGYLEDDMGLEPCSPTLAPRAAPDFGAPSKGFALMESKFSEAAPLCSPARGSSSPECNSPASATSACSPEPLEWSAAPGVCATPASDLLSSVLTSAAHAAAAASSPTSAFSSFSPSSAFALSEKTHTHPLGKRSREDALATDAWGGASSSCSPAVAAAAAAAAAARPKRVKTEASVGAREVELELAALHSSSVHSGGWGASSPPALCLSPCRARSTSPLASHSPSLSFSPPPPSLYAFDELHLHASAGSAFHASSSSSSASSSSSSFSSSFSSSSSSSPSSRAQRSPPSPSSPPSSSGTASSTGSPDAQLERLTVAMVRLGMKRRTWSDEHAAGGEDSTAQHQSKRRCAHTPHELGSPGSGSDSSAW
eukprot:TRINITY_DN1823_c0_g1_i3.p1 TRINITY_DN1823_c0_g1~~TRINITY_DN1823_c0_g1_i3.p1  ORF type:complete len:381 (-),score=160.11 TRINITY_DN1823_c0_g1_i3:1324-2466(-)